MAFPRLELRRVKKRFESHAKKAEEHEKIHAELSTMAKMVDAAETVRIERKLKKDRLADSYEKLLKHFESVERKFPSKKQFVDRTLHEYLKDVVAPYVGLRKEEREKTLEEYLSGDLTNLHGLRESLESLAEKHASIYTENAGKAAELEEKMKQLEKKALLASINKQVLKR
ncbi:hypothetical protein H0N96_00005 [Candidatus Micrarchaeota archaeon]|nr:hypothetical protein [Candidatus Micrarchaeota archaeon]